VSDQHGDEDSTRERARAALRDALTVAVRRAMAAGATPDELVQLLCQRLAALEHVAGEAPSVPGAAAEDVPDDPDQPG
jgi:hypothetical protein